LVSRTDTFEVIRVLQRSGRYFQAISCIGMMCVIAILFAPLDTPAQRAGANFIELPQSTLQPPSLVKSTEDLDGILAKRALRILVVPNLTNYFIERGRQRGITYESFTLFGTFLERTRQLQLRMRSRVVNMSVPVKLQVVFVPVSISQPLCIPISTRSLSADREPRRSARWRICQVKRCTCVAKPVTTKVSPL
jgi:hypothetical protein